MLRGGGGTRTQSLAEAPVLSFDSGLERFTWTNGGPQPDHWQAQVSADGVSGWTNGWTAPGGDTQIDFSPDDPFWRLAGFTAGDVQSTEWSNTVDTSI